jgi:hypothetical protein
LDISAKPGDVVAASRNWHEADCRDLHGTMDLARAEERGFSCRQRGPGKRRRALPGSRRGPCPALGSHLVGLVEKHGTKTRRSWRKLHIGMDAGTGEIAAAALTTGDVDDASQVGPLLKQLEAPLASFTGDGAYDPDGVYRAVNDRDRDAAVIVPHARRRC